MTEKDEKVLLTAYEVAEILDVRLSRAYTIIRVMNKEMAAKGKLTLRGRVNRKYLEEKLSI
jgi:hypothetical protein